MFILIDAIVHGIFSFHVLVPKKTIIFFFNLNLFNTLYLWTGQKSHIGYSRFLCTPVNFNVDNHASRAGIILFFLFNVHTFISLAFYLKYFLHTTLNRKGEEIDACLVPKLRGNTSIVSQLCKLLSIGSLQLPLKDWQKCLSIPSLLQVFFMSVYWVFSSDFSASLWMNM